MNGIIFINKYASFLEVNDFAILIQKQWNFSFDYIHHVGFRMCFRGTSTDFSVHS